MLPRCPDELSSDLRRALAAFLLSRFCAVALKGDAVEMMVVAGVFGVVKLFGASVPSSEEFQTRYWTTLGPVIYAPAGSRRAGEHLRCSATSSPTSCSSGATRSTSSRYLTSKGRAGSRPRPSAARAVWWILTGTIPADLGAVDITRHGYALDDGHADLTRDLLEQAVTSVRAGVLSTDVGSRSRAGARHEPDDLVGTVIL